jgi:hypothetical protein
MVERRVTGHPGEILSDHASEQLSRLALRNGGWQDGRMDIVSAMSYTLCAGFHVDLSRPS